MARLIKCPRCQSQVDVTNVSGGTTVRCPDCGANLRVPTGQTGHHPKVNAGTPAPQPAAGGGKSRGRQTDLFRKMSGPRSLGGRSSSRGGGRPARRKNSNSGMFIGLGVGALVVAIALTAVMMSGGGQPVKPPTPNDTSNQASAPPPRVEDTTPVPKTPDKKEKTKIKRSGKGKYQAPATFQPGAKAHAERLTNVFPEVPIDEDLSEEFGGLAMA